MGRGQHLSKDLFTAVIGETRGRLRQNTDCEGASEKLIQWSPFLVSYLNETKPDSPFIIRLIEHQEAYRQLLADVGLNPRFQVAAPDKKLTALAKELNAAYSQVETVNKVIPVKAAVPFDYQLYIKGACYALVMHDEIKEADYLALCQPVQEMVEATVDFYEEMRIFEAPETKACFTDNRPRLDNKGRDWVPVGSVLASEQS